MRSQSPLALDIAKSLLRLDEATGVLYWLVTVNSRAPAGRAAGCKRVKDGYIQVRVRGQIYLAHQIVWLLHHGVWPDHEIDHINGVPDDNRPRNVRRCTHSQNIANTAVRNPTGFKGVRCVRGKYLALLTHKQKQRYLGTFDTPEEASAVYLAEARRAFGAFARAS